MTNSRSLLLLLLSVCLLRSPAGFSENGRADDLAAPDELEPVELSMLMQTQSALPTDDIKPISIIDEDIQRVSDSASAKQFSTEELAQLRRLFLQAEVAIENNNDARYFQLAGQLVDFPLYPYLQYQWLKKNLENEPQVKLFLEQHGTTRYAALLQQKWLYHLAKKGQWQTFLKYYNTSSDTGLQCYYHRAQYNTGNKQAALAGASELWAVGQSQPSACDPLFSVLEKSSLFKQPLFWQRFDAALRNNKITLATYVKKLMPAVDQEIAGLWLKLHNNPERHLPELLKSPWAPQSALMFTHTINRLANTDVNQAISVWDKHKQRYNISKQELDKLEKRLAFKLAYENDSAAYERLGQLDESDSSSKAMRIRVALYEQNWPRVVTAIEDLNAESQALEKWQYWLARAYYETGRPLQAEELFSELSGKRDYYGYLAAERLNRLYQLSDKPIDVTPEQIADIQNRDAFRAAFELMLLERDNDAKLQWWHALRHLDKNDYPTAAKLAQKWRWDEIAIFTIAKVEQWDDIEMRFPLSYADKIQENAILQKLNPVILFGLVRRESAFNKDARSASGAQGLMQIMPNTGRQIASDLDERWPGSDSLYDPVKNIQYGSYYYQKLLKQFDGHYAIALAAYNAGPNRVKKWLPDASMPADIWIETIPFSETRDYVSSVLVYAMIYQQRMRTAELTMHDLTRDVQKSRPNELSMSDLTQDVQPYALMP